MRLEADLKLMFSIPWNVINHSYVCPKIRLESLVIFIFISNLTVTVCGRA